MKVKRKQKKNLKPIVEKMYGASAPDADIPGGMPGGMPGAMPPQDIHTGPSVEDVD